MQFLSFVSVAALASIVAAQSNVIKLTNAPTSCAVGSPCTVEWSTTASGPVTLTLRKGLSTNLKDVEVLTASGTGGTFTFTPTTALVTGTDYAIMISQGTEVNYSGLFTITGGSTSSSASSSSASSTSSSASSSSASSSSSKSSSASSTLSTSVTLTTSSSTASSTPSNSANGTLASSTGTRAPTGTSSPTTVPAPGAASGFQASSPVALLFGVVAAFMYLN